MKHLLVRLFFIGSVIFGLSTSVDQDDNYRKQVTINERGFMRLNSQKPYPKEQLDQPAPLFNPEKDTHFLLYTRDTADSPHQISNNDVESVTSSRFNASHPTRVVIHGWGSDRNSRINRLIRTELFEVGEFNVIFVDWSAGFDPFYPNSRRLVYPVGIATSNIIDFLVKVRYLNINDVVVIGHSLGAHVAGNVGKGQFGRLPIIIGLDPALPLFPMDAIDRIKQTDGKYVEIIHTNGGVLGVMNPIGHTDFYPNWGRIQPGCGVDIDGGCAHQRAVDFYVESIASRLGLVGRQCSDFQDIRSGMCTETGVQVKMGGEPSNGAAVAARGVFFFATAGGKPFVTEC